ncbi:MAG TPA: HNH endonuclease signature motif containing protein [Allosphingosinicella sp.]|jgi:5-methylcytosine-specific restriction protein A
MATRQFRTDESISAERATRDAVAPLLSRHGFEVIADERIERGSAITQVIVGRRGSEAPVRMHVRLCWRRDGRNPRENLYSATQLRARLNNGGWEATLEAIAAKEAADGHTHLLLVQDSDQGFVFAAILPCDQIPAIWARQRDVSAELISSGRTGNVLKNHAMNGSSPTLWLQDDRSPGNHAVADVLWTWPGVINVLTLTKPDADLAVQDDSWDDLAADDESLGRDAGERRAESRSGYPRDPRVRAAVRERAGGRCERARCGTSRPYPGFLDVHHLLGIGFSDRVWSCVALCPNCHREAHYAPDRDRINAALRDYASQFAP